MPPKGKKRGSNPPTGPAKKLREQSPTTEAGQSSASANTQSEEEKVSSHIEALARLWQGKDPNDLLDKLTVALGCAVSLKEHLRAKGEEFIRGFATKYFEERNKERKDLEQRAEAAEEEAEEALLKAAEAKEAAEEARLEKEEAIIMQGIMQESLRKARYPPASICMYPSLAVEPTPTRPPTPSPPSAPLPSSPPPPPSPPSQRSVPRRQILSVKAMVVHGVPCHRRLETMVQETEQAIGVGGIVAKGRWLLKQERRKDKATSSVVLYFDRMISIAFRGQPSLEIRGRKLRIERYQFGHPKRKGKEAEVEGWSQW